MRIRIEGWIRNNTGVMYFLLFFILISFSKIIFLTNYHYSTDSIFINYRGFPIISEVVLHSNGRLLFLALAKVSYLSKTSVGAATQISLMFAIITASLTSTIIVRKINSIIGTKKYNVLLVILVLLVFTSPLMLELFYFYESFVMQLSIMFSVLAASIIVSESSTRLLRILISTILLAMTLLSYQTSFVVFVIYFTLLLALDCQSNIKILFSQQKLKRITDAFLALIISFGSVAVLSKLIMKVSRANQIDFSQILNQDNYFNMARNFKMVYSDFSVAYASIFILIFFCIVILLIARKQYLKLLNFITTQLVICIEALTLSVVPVVLSKGQTIEPRMMAGVILCASLIPIVFMTIENKTSKAKSILVFPFIVLLSINIAVGFRWQNASIENARIDAEWSKAVSSIIKTNSSINRAISFRDANIKSNSNKPVSYSSGVTTVNIRASMTDWSTIESLYLYSNLRLDKLNPIKDKKYFAYESYCKSHDWDSFHPDQVKFIEDVAIICVY